MSALHRPPLPIPAPLRGSEYDSFAYHSIVERLPRIGRRVLDTNDFPRPVASRLEALLEEIPHARIRRVQDTGAPDAEEWLSYVDPYRGYDWLEVPWFFAELYFYRRILEATGYFTGGPRNGVDPFAPQKQKSLESSRRRIQTLSERLSTRRQAGWTKNDLSTFLAIALWGNQGDLSMWPEGEAQPGQEGRGTPTEDDDYGEREEYLLADERAAVARYLQDAGGDIRIDILMDNAGFELVSDLALIDYFLDSGLAREIYLHLKSDPVLVSDALSADVHETVDVMATDGSPPIAAFGRRLRRYLEEERVKLLAHPFWNSPLAAWEMPPELRETLAAAALVLSKGDANYRRLLGDRHWAATTPFAEIVAYFPAPLLALRTLKSDLAAGIAPERISALTAQGVRWTTSGEWGVIQFAPQRAQEATDE